jgi:enoyl-CoA hydratase/carnithine racemase
MTEILVKQEIIGQVGVISFNRPEVHNALDDEAQAQLLEAARRMSDDLEVRAIVLRGEGKSFCAGRDTRVLGQRDPADSDFSFVKRAQQVQHVFMDCSKPVVAAIKGAAIGGGFELALAADMRVAGHSARMSLPEVVYGLLPDMGGTQTLRSMVGRSRAKYLIMTGEQISAEQAYEWGIADWLVDDAEVDSTAMAIAEKIAANSPQAVMMVKHLVDQVDYGQVKSGLRQELTSICTLFKSEDYQEARLALQEKRKPEFKGK